ncbi:MAG: GldG family protein [Leptospirales bacterium]
MEKFKNSKLVTTILIVLIFASLNWLSYGFNWRYDLSASGRFKITNSTQGILENLPGKITIEAFFSEEYPDEFIQPVKQLRDFLTEYAAGSSGKVRLRFLNPDNDSGSDPSQEGEIRERARSLGIRPRPIGAQGGNTQQISSVYFSLALSYEDKTEIIPDIISASGSVLEYNITARIYKMAYPGLRKVGIWTANTMFSTSEQQNPYIALGSLVESLEPFYGELVSVNGENFPNDISTLIIIQPESLSEAEKLTIDQFILKGGKLLLAMAGIQIDIQKGVSRPVDPDLLSFFAHYGIEIEPALLLEPENFIPMEVGSDSYNRRQWKYPMWVRVKQDGLSTASVITENMKDVIFPWVSPVRFNKEKAMELEMVQLASTTDNAWLQKGNINIDPNVVQAQLLNPTRPDTGKYNIAMHIKGKFKSFFAQNQSYQNSEKTIIKESQAPAQIVVTGTPYMFSYAFIQISHLLNLNFFLSSLDVMSGLDELVQARSRKVVLPVLHQILPWKKSLFNIVNFFLPLFAIIGYGVLRLLGRKKMQSIPYASTVEISAEPIEPTEPKELENPKGSAETVGKNKTEERN